MNPTVRYWEQVLSQRKLALEERETLLRSHQAVVEDLREKVREAETFLNNAKRSNAA